MSSNSDSNIGFPRIASPFITCVIGSSKDKAITVGNTNLGLMDKGYIDPQFIKSIHVERSTPNESGGGLVETLLNYIREINPENGVLTTAERTRAGKDADKQAKAKAEAFEKMLKEAPKKLEQALQGLGESYAQSAVSMGGVTATITLSFLHELNLMTWLYNYSVEQNLAPSIRFQYGIIGQGSVARQSIPYEGIIVDAQIDNWYDLTLTVNCTPAKYLGWAPEKFNQIFNADSKTKTAKKSNNPTRPYNEGDVAIASTVKKKRYSDIVKMIADGLGWKYIDNVTIKQTKELPEEVLVTVDHYDEGPLQYIISNYCGVTEQKNNKDGIYRSGAVSESGSAEGYVAFFELDSEGNDLFYYVPKRYVTRNFVSPQTKIYEFDVRGTNNGTFNSEVINFRISPVRLYDMQWNLYKKDGKGEVNQAVIANEEKEIKNNKITSETRVETGGASTPKLSSKGSVQAPKSRSIHGSTEYMLNQFEADKQYNITNTWIGNQMEADMDILFDPSIKLFDIIYVKVVCPMNSSLVLNGEVVNKTLIHPSSGFYRVHNISEDISDGTAITRLKLMRVVVSQEEANLFSKTFAGDPNKVAEQQSEKEKINKRELK